jgi:DNA-directed RNA polymerase specialized sigma24 family protein
VSDLPPKRQSLRIWKTTPARKTFRFRQKNARESKRLQFSDALVETLSGEAEEFLENTDDTLAALERCVQKLPEKQRNMVAWRFEPGGTNREISRTPEKPVSHLYVSMLRRLGIETDQFATGTSTMTGLEMG